MQNEVLVRRYLQVGVGVCVCVCVRGMLFVYLYAAIEMLVSKVISVNCHFVTLGKLQLCLYNMLD